MKMRNLQRRVLELEAKLNDPSGHIPQSTEWLDYWKNVLLGEPSPCPPRIPIEAFRAVVGVPKAKVKPVY